MTQITDTVTSEQIAYAYDSLKRLILAAASASSLGTGWGESFAYDGFGNLTDKNVTAGSAPVIVQHTPEAARQSVFRYRFEVISGCALAGAIVAFYSEASNIGPRLPIATAAAVVAMRGSMLRMRSMDWAIVLGAAGEIPSFVFSQYRANSTRTVAIVVTSLAMYFAILRQC